MLQNMNDMLLEAQKNKYAIFQFNINNLEWTKFILSACEEVNSPVILGVSEGAINYMGGLLAVVGMVKGLLASYTIPVALHLDHGSYSMCLEAIEAGFTSVMIDASRETLEKNIELTKKIVDIAKENNVSVETEIGAIGGVEDDISAQMAYARVEDAILLIEKSGASCLAPALGSVHGVYKGEPCLDFERMVQIRDLVKVPLVLHGGSGISDDLIRKAINCGVCKININTELQVAWTQAVREFLIKNEQVYDPRKIIKSGETAIKEIVKEKITLFGPKHQI